MILVFNRRELTVTYSMSEQTEVREALTGEGIPYRVRTVDSLGSGPLPGGRARMGSTGVNTSGTVEYIFYVRREDFDRALSVIGQSAIR